MVGQLQYFIQEEKDNGVKEPVQNEVGVGVREELRLSSPNKLYTLAYLYLQILTISFGSDEEIVVHGSDIFISDAEVVVTLNQAFISLAKGLYSGDT